MRSSSISLRTKSKSVCDAEGNATSISLKPIRTSCSNMRSLRSTLIGSIRAWFPSRRSVLIQMGGCSMMRSGQARDVVGTVGKRRYFAAGFDNMDDSFSGCGKTRT
jgi:hypothetical protein